MPRISMKSTTAKKAASATVRVAKRRRRRRVFLESLEQRSLLAFVKGFGSVLDLNGQVVSDEPLDKQFGYLSIDVRELASDFNFLEHDSDSVKVNLDPSICRDEVIADMMNW